MFGYEYAKEDSGVLEKHAVHSIRDFTANRKLLIVVSDASEIDATFFPLENR